jgi:hypothetical protein
MYIWATRHAKILCGKKTFRKFHSSIAFRKTELICKHTYYSASHSRVAPENVGLQKEQKCNTFVFHTCNEVRFCVLGIRKKEVGNTKKIR